MANALEGFYMVTAHLVLNDKTQDPYIWISATAKEERSSKQQYHSLEEKAKGSLELATMFSCLLGQLRFPH